MPRERPRFDAAVLVKLAKMRHRLLNDPPANANAAHQAPIAVNLAVLPRVVWRRYMRQIKSDSPPPENTLGRHYTPKSAPPSHLTP